MKLAPKARGVPLYRQVLRDYRVSDGAKLTLMELKSRAQHGMATVPMKDLAIARHLSRDTINEHIKELIRYRLLTIKNNSFRGNRTASTYFIEDTHFARFLAVTKKPSRCRKNPTGVPSVHSNIPATVQDPPNLLRLQLPLPQTKQSA